MKRRIPLAIAAAVLCLTANAKQISIQQAENVARKYIVTKSSQKRLRHAGQQATAPYYAFNSDNGFVVVSGDDSLTELVCYSDHGTIDTDNLPAPLKELLEDYAGYVKAVQNGTAKAVRTETSSNPTVIVSPMVTTKWNQNAPYNNMVPTGCATGCAATALAQVMNYHEWPDTGVGSNTYPHSTYGEISVDFSQSTYDWANMLDEYTEGNYTDEQANAVAKLMYDCGVALNMNYGPSSGASTYAYSQCATFFKYNIDIISRDNRSTADNIKLVTDELNDCRPFIIAAQSLSGGHAFVADGYDSNNFLHINWGWGGLSDAYFNLNYLDPASQGIGGGSGAYSRYQSFIFFTPIRNGETPEGNTSLGYLTRDGAGVGCTSTTFDKSEQAPFTLTYIYNNGSKDFAGNIALGIFDSSNNLVARSESADFPDDNPFKSGYYFTDVANFPIDLSSLPDGSYTALGIYRLSSDDDDETKWNKFDAKSAVYVTISGDNVTAEEPKCHLALSNSIAMSGNFGLGHIVSFSANIVNSSLITVDGYINYTVTKKSDGSIVKSGSERAIIYDGSNYDTKVGVYLSENNFEPGETYVFSINDFTTTGGESTTITNDYGENEFTTTYDEPLAQKQLYLVTSKKEAKCSFSDDQFSIENSDANLYFGLIYNKNADTFVGQVGYIVNKFKGENVYTEKMTNIDLGSGYLFTDYFSASVYSSPIASLTDNGIYSIFAASAEQIDDAYPDEMVKFANADNYRLDFRFTDGIITQLHPETTVKQAAATTVSGNIVLDSPVTFACQLENMYYDDVVGTPTLDIYDKNNQLITSVTAESITIPAYSTTTAEFPCTLASSDFNEGETYTVRLSDFSNYYGYSFSANTDYDYTFNAATSSVGSLTNAAVKVYPNPAVDAIHTSTIANRIAVYSISGALVAEAANTDSISVASLTTGCYIVAITANGSTTRHQVFKK